MRAIVGGVLGVALLAPSCAKEEARPALYGAVRPEWGPPQPGDPAPDFELPRTFEEGSTARLSSLRGSWVLLHFTATWCPFCDAEIASLGKIADAYAPRNVKVVLVGVEEPLTRWVPYAKERVHPPLIALHDLDGKAASRFAPPRLQPSFEDRAETILAGSLVIDPRGVIRMFVVADSVHFDSTLADVRGELDRLLGDGRGTAVAAGNVAGDLVVSTSAAPVNAARGSKGEIVIAIDIAEGWHTMSDHPSKPEYVPTTLALSAEGITFGHAVFPAPSSFVVGEGVISTFEGHVLVRVPFEVQANAAAGRHPVAAELRYQACTRGSCRSPRTDHVSASIDVDR